MPEDESKHPKDVIQSLKEMSVKNSLNYNRTKCGKVKLCKWVNRLVTLNKNDVRIYSTVEELKKVSVNE